MRILLLMLCSMAAASAYEAVITAGTPERTTAPLKAAPGQILTLRVRGLATKFDATQVATTIPLPRDFGGVSVTLRQSGSSSVVRLPLIRGDFDSNCAWAVVIPDVSTQLPCTDTDTGMFTFQVQIPYELQANPPGPLNRDAPNVFDATVRIEDHGQQGRDIRVTPVLDQIHLVRQCNRNGVLFGEDTCEALIYHANATAVTSESPAHGGEVLVAYAYGLGAPMSAVPSGSATPDSGVGTARPVSVRFTGVGGGENAALYSGLVPGQVGLYQINFRVPVLPAGLPGCSTSMPANLTMMVRGSASSDTVSFCAQP